LTQSIGKKLKIKKALDTLTYPLDEKRTVLFLLILLFVAVSLAKAYNSYEIAISFDNYVSDEVWYVTSARTLLYKVFDIEPRFTYNGLYGYTVFCNSKESVNQVVQQVTSLGGEIIKDSYKKINAVSIAIDDNLIDRIKNIDGVIDVIPGYPYPDKENINRYYNFEHPPLGKFLIALSIAILGDTPFNWRMPGIIEVFIIGLIVGYLAYRLLGLIGAFLSMLAFYFDPITTNSAAVAMLDIHLAFFASLAMLFLYRKRFGVSLIFAGLATMVKYSGLFYVLPFYYFYRKTTTPTKTIIKIAVIVGIVAIIVFSSLISSFGAERMVQEFFGALKWHTTSRPTGPEPSNPIDWFLGIKSFYFYINPDIPARGLPFIYVPVFIVGLVLLPLTFKKRLAGKYGLKNYLYYNLTFFAVIFGFFAIMLMGNRTLYSFYLVELSPLAYVLFPSSLFYMLYYSEPIGKSINVIYQSMMALLSGKWILWEPPKEVRWFWKIMRYPRLRVMASMIIVISIASFFAHIDFGQQLKLFSDAHWMVWSKGALSDEPSRLMGFIGLTSIVLGKASLSGNYLLLLDLVGLVLFVNELRIFVENNNIILRKKLFFYPLILSLFVYGIYDGSGFSLFLFMMGLNMLFEKRRLESGILLGMSASNPIMLLAISVFLVQTHRKVFVAFLGGLMLSNFVVWVYSGFYNWINSFLSFFNGIKGVGPALLFPYPNYILPLYIILVALTILFLSNRITNPIYKLVIITLGFISFLPNSLPQWLIFILPFVLLMPPIVFVPLLVSDALNSSIIFLWFSNVEFMKAFFKYTPASPLDIFSAPALAYYFRMIFLLLVFYRLYVFYRKKEIEE